MAKITKLVDDLDGTTEAEMTLTFGLDGTEYEIDLADGNYEQYRATLELLAAKGRPVTRQVATKRTLSGKKTDKPVTGKTQHIREYLRGLGHQVSDRGRIPENLMKIWNERPRDVVVKAPEVPADSPKDVDEDKAEENAVITRVRAVQPPAKTSSRKAKRTEPTAVREVLKFSDAE